MASARALLAATKAALAATGFVLGLRHTVFVPRVMPSRRLAYRHLAVGIRVATKRAGHRRHRIPNNNLPAWNLNALSIRVRLG